MNSDSLMKYIYLALRDKSLTYEEVKVLQKDRLNELVSYSRAHSPYFRKLYENLGKSPSLSELPVTRKPHLMDSFNEWVTDPRISKDLVLEFMSDKENIGRYLLDKCSVSVTSGSTGNPCTVLTDKGAYNLTMALYFVRAIPVRDLLRLGLKRGKYFIIANHGFSMSYNSYRAQILSTPLNKLRCQAVNVDTNAEDIIRALNRFKPAILYAYPTTMELLLPYIENGTLKAKPSVIILGGERCPERLRWELSRHTRGFIFNTYGTSEASLIARTCSHGHLHLFADWVIVEPVDKDDQPVPMGTPSDRLLITNLANYTQPFIRYEVTDRITMYDDPCPCGSAMPYIEVEGRTDDILEFLHPKGKVQISPMVLTNPADKEGIIRYQLIQKSSEHLELKLLIKDGYSKGELFDQVREELMEILSGMGVSKVKITLSPDIPKTHPISGKYPMVLKDLADSMDPLST